MKKLICCIVISAQFLTYHHISALSIPNKYSAEDAEGGFHQYIKWTELARGAVKTKHPRAEILDFLYVGCSVTSSSTKQYVYKYWVREENREFGVYVTVVENKWGRKRVSKIENTDRMIAYYGKWRRIAKESVRQKYPDAIINGEATPIRCRWIRNNEAIQTFTLWLDRNDTSHIVEVSIQYRIDTDQLLSVNIQDRRSLRG
ncbi:DUF3889 domain-containing protein [Paenibacillus sp. BC26]|uniref:DUF3889 domain-containing protein n=1 Tax=Paenibacillus sp. BC26 TaxID=1881032 RepID=UPI0008EE21E9|nr:DUF3889 domain-containing protein [Paenibacillus sp. BC26]SFS75940.1 Protein of unknown function [Paenibacillus sp. BC26]